MAEGLFLGALFAYLLPGPQGGGGLGNGEIGYKKFRTRRPSALPAALDAAPQLTPLPSPWLPMLGPWHCAPLPCSEGD